MPFLPPNQQHQSTEYKKDFGQIARAQWCLEELCQLFIHVFCRWLNQICVRHIIMDLTKRTYCIIIGYVGLFVPLLCVYIANKSGCVGSKYHYFCHGSVQCGNLAVSMHHKLSCHITLFTLCISDGWFTQEENDSVQCQKLFDSVWFSLICCSQVINLLFCSCRLQT